MAYQNDFGVNVPGGSNDIDVIRNYDNYRLSTMPYAILNNYNRIAQGGIYGQEGMNQMTAASRMAAAYRIRKMLAAANRGGAASRLGPRSGAYSTMLSNNVYAPYVAEDANRQASILRENYMSRLQGLSGASDIMAFLQNRNQAQWDKPKKGLIDYVTALASGAAAATAA